MIRLPLPFALGLTASLAFGWIVFPRLIQRVEAQPLRFSHKTHTGEKGGMKCEDCHSLRADGTFTGVPATEKCAGCHAAQLGTSPDEKKLVAEFVTPNREVSWKIYSRQPDNTFFSHAYHVKLAKIACRECHQDHGNTDSLSAYSSNRISAYGPLQTMSDCEQCHLRRGVSAGCLDCHK